MAGGSGLSGASEQIRLQAIGGAVGADQRRSLLMFHSPSSRPFLIPRDLHIQIQAARTVTQFPL
jgi:hypothetical protein